MQALHFAPFLNRRLTPYDAASAGFGRRRYSMQPRMDFRTASPDGAKAIAQLHAFEHRCGLERTLLELVKLRASQINGCAQCIDMHTKELRADGEDEQRLYLLNAWHEAPIYSERE